jgi:hypothetical protein
MVICRAICRCHGANVPSLSESSQYYSRNLAVAMTATKVRGMLMALCVRCVIKPFLVILGRRLYVEAPYHSSRGKDTFSSVMVEELNKRIWKGNDMR